MRSYTAIVERCQETGLYVGFIPGFQGAHTQAETLDELNQNLREIVEFHSGRDVSPILLRQIAKDIGLTVEELLNFRA